MSPATALLLVAVGSGSLLAAVLLIGIVETRSTRARYAGRRDQHHRRLNQSRMGRDSDYAAGAVDEYLYQLTTRRQGGPR